MKIDFVLSVFSLCVTSLVAYCFYGKTGGTSYSVLVAFGSGICLFITLAGCIAVTIEKEKIKKVYLFVSAIFLALFIMSNVIFTFIFLFALPYTMINGSMLVAYVVTVYAVLKSAE